MLAGLLLDGLLLLVVALYVPIGALRGGLREALLGGSILLGAATAAALAPTWGDALAEPAGIAGATGRFLVAIALLLLVGLGVGFGAGAVAGPGIPGLESRVVGGLIGGANALLLLSYALTFLNRYLHDGRTNETVDAGWFADALAEHRGWLLGAVSLLAAGLVAVYRLIVRSGDGVVPQEVPWAEAMAGGPRRRLAVAPPADPDGGKVEPTREPATWAELNADSAGSIGVPTRPVVPTAVDADRYVVEPVAFSPQGNSRGGSGAQAGGETANGGSVIDEWLRRAAERGGSSGAVGGPDPAAFGQGPRTEERPDLFSDAALRNLLDPRSRLGQRPLPSVNPHAGLIPGLDPTSAEPSTGPSPAQPGALDPVRRCDVCGTPAATDLTVCPFCGSPL